MATNIAEALQSAGAVSAKPVTLETIPEATIDVGGGSQPLDIEGLGVKRRKDDLSVTKASTSQVAIQDLFGDLLDEVNFADPASVDAFKANAASRIDEFDSNTFNSIASGASTVADDLANLAGPLRVTPAAQPVQQQFQQVFGPSRVTTGDDADPQTSDIGLDTTASTELQDISNLSNPGLAASLFGGALGNFGGRGDITDLAINLGTRSLGDLNFVGAATAADSLANAKLDNIFDATGAINTAVAVAGKAKQVSNLVGQGATIGSLFDRAAKRVGEYIEGIYTAVTNPDQTMEAYGRKMEFGTLTPELYSFNFKGGKMNFAFDAKTGLVATPGLIAAMMPAPLRGVYGLSQQALNFTGYAGEMADRNLAAVEAFSMPGVEVGNMTLHTNPSGAAMATDSETGKTTGMIGAFAAVDMNNVGYGMVGMDLGAMVDVMGPDGKVTDLDFTDLQQLSISGHLGHGPVDPEEEEDIAAAMHEAFGKAGMADTQSIAENGVNKANSLTQTMVSEFEAITGRDLSQLNPGMGALTRADTLATLSAKDLRANPAATFASALAALQTNVPTLGATMTREERLSAYRVKLAGMEEKSIQNTIEPVASYGAGGYNSPTPSNKNIEIAMAVMEETQKPTVDAVRDREVINRKSIEYHAREKAAAINRANVSNPAGYFESLVDQGLSEAEASAQAATDLGYDAGFDETGHEGLY